MQRRSESRWNEPSPGLKSRDFKNIKNRFLYMINGRLKMFHKFYSDRELGFWRFFSDTRIFFGREETVKKFPEIVALHGERVGVLTDKTVEGLSFTKKFLSAISDKTCCVSHIGLEADYDDIKKAVELFRGKGVDVIVAVGGGSVIDGAKFVSVAVNNDIDLLEFEFRQTLENKKVPLIAVPTTFGTGSDVDLYVFINDRKKKMTISFKKDFLAPEAAILNPDVMKETPPRTKYLSGIDCFLHTLEVLTLKREKSPIQECLSQAGIRLFLDNFRACIENPSMENEDAIATVSLLGGIGINNSRPGLIHTLAKRFAKHFHVPHPVSLLPFIIPALEFNWEHVRGCFGSVPFEAFKKELQEKALFFHINDLDGLEADEAVIEMMSEECMLDTVIRKENPAPLGKEAFRRLYTTAFERLGSGLKKTA